MYAGDLLAIVRQSETESELGYPLGLGSCYDLQGFNNARDRLVLQARVLAFRVFSNDAEVDVIVTRLVARYIFNQDDRGVDV